MNTTPLPAPAEMTPRERWMALLERRTPDRIPTDIWATDEVYQRLFRDLGCSTYEALWRKLHIGIDAKTIEIRAIEVTSNSVGDAPVLPSLLEQIDRHEALLSVSGSGAYVTKVCSIRLGSGEVFFLSLVFSTQTLRMLRALASSSKIKNNITRSIRKQKILYINSTIKHKN